MQIWNAVCGSLKYRTQNIAKKSRSAHHRTNLFATKTTKTSIDNRTKIVKQQYVLHKSSQYGERRPINGWDRFGSLGHPSKFQRVSRVGFVTPAMSLNRGQPNFARCLTVSWVCALYILRVSEKNWTLCYFVISLLCQLRVTWKFPGVHRKYYLLWTWNKCLSSICTFDVFRRLQNSLFKTPLIRNYLHAKFHLDPSNRLATIHQRHRQDRTGQTDRQRSDSIGRTVLQTVAQKLTSYCKYCLL